MKTIKINKTTFGGLIIERIKLLLLEPKDNAFEIVILVKGLTGEMGISILNVQDISVHYDYEDVILTYPKANGIDTDKIAQLKHYFEVYRSHAEKHYKEGNTNLLEYARGQVMGMSKVLNLFPIKGINVEQELEQLT